VKSVWNNWLAFWSAIINRRARSLRAGMAEILTLQRLKLPPSLYKYLATANLIESPRSGVAKVPSSVFQLLHDINSALDNYSVRCFLNRKIYFSIREV
jgi:hypothetical protein